MLRDATRAWTREKATPEPFTGLTCHDLRHTATNLMREAGMPVELAAERLGHKDGGALLLRTYGRSALARRGRRWTRSAKAYGRRR